MAESKRDIEERAFRFACDIVRFCDRQLSAGRVLNRLLLQLVDASTAVGANLEEAAAGQSKADFIAKVCIARKEAREARYWLRVIVACYEPCRPALLPLIGEGTELLAIISAIVRKARSNPGRG